MLRPSSVVQRCANRLVHGRCRGGVGAAVISGAAGTTPNGDQEEQASPLPRLVSERLQLKIPAHLYKSCRIVRTRLLKGTRPYWDMPHMCWMLDERSHELSKCGREPLRGWAT